MQSQRSGATPASRGIRIGDPVVDPAGQELGEVTRIIVDARTDSISGLVVRPGGLLAKERIIPRDRLEPSARGLRSELTATEFDELSPFDGREYQAPDPDYSGPPGFDRESAAQANLALDTVVAMGALGAIGTSAKPFGYPGGETREPASNLAATDGQLPVIERGTDILDASGSKIGEVESVTFDASGRPSALSAKQGFLFSKTLEIPPAWIDQVTRQGVLLNVSEDKLQSYAGGH